MTSAAPTDCGHTVGPWVAEELKQAVQHLTEQLAFAEQHSRAVVPSVGVDELRIALAALKQEGK